MIYAPVIIPTLNRYEHFKRCIEALERNKWAKYTEVFVSVDYPPNEKYREGFEKIVEYMKTRSFAFEKLNLFVQKKNLGVNKNFEFLYEKVYAKYDRVISLEDDVETSLNFLEFMNKALEEYESDEHAMCVCGFSDNIKKPSAMQGTVYKVRSCTWGRGYWRDKRLKAAEETTKQWVDTIVHDWKSMLKIFIKGRDQFYVFFTGYVLGKKPVFFNDEGEIQFIDIIGGIYMIMNDMYSIVPTKSKVRNWGTDGSGQNSGVRAGKLAPQRQEFDEDEHFDLRMEEDRRIKRIIAHRFRKFSRYSSFKVWEALLYYFYLRMTKRLEDN